MIAKRLLSTVALASVLLASWAGIAHATSKTAVELPLSGTHPVTILRGVYKSDGTAWVTSPGFTVTHTGVGTYHISFPAGTWGSPSCWFVPVFQPIFSAGMIDVTGLAEYGNGSGQMDIKISTGDSWFSMTATSASC